MKKLHLLIALFFVLLISNKAEACVCMNFDTVCDAYENAKAVIVGEVRSIREFENTNVQGSFQKGRLIVLTILKSYKGDLKNSVEIWQPSTSCDYHFEETAIGKQFLLYLNNFSDPTRYSIIVCGRSRQIVGGEGDISWLDGLPNSLKRSFFYGSFHEYAYDEDDWPKFKARMSNVTVELTSNKNSFKKTSNKSGSFEIWDLPNDIYKLKIDAGKKFRYEDSVINGIWDINPENEKTFDPLNDQMFEVDGAGCAEIRYDLMKGKKR